MDKLISQQAAIDKIKKRLFETAFNNVGIKQNIDETLIDVAENRLKNWLDELPSVQPNHCAEVGKKVLIDRQAALETIRTMQTYKLFAGDDMLLIDQAEAQTELMMLPSVQPERTCVNCGRTVNNGGWYADGRTRCPIEEHYALPKDGYCHLWEKRNITDDDYPERREE